MEFSSYQAALNDALKTIHIPSLEALATTLHRARLLGATVFTCGNGGSAANASHLAQDLSKGTYVEQLPYLRCICLNDSVPSLTAWSNDEGYDQVFYNQLKILGRQGDVLIAISGSGSSPNILTAVLEAHELEMHTWGITGFDGGELVNLAHRSIHVLCADMGMVEAAHGILFHWLVGALLDKAEMPRNDGVKVWA
jgi:D-sedoheptulose 7-phosphate isomerase